MVNLLLVDDDFSFRLGLRSWLERTHDWTIVGEISNKTEALQIMETDKTIDLVILELGIAEGLELCQILKRDFAETPLFLLTNLPRSVILEGALAMGTEGYCPKGTESKTLIAALKTVSLGNKYYWQPPRSEKNLGRSFGIFMQEKGFNAIDQTLFELSQIRSTQKLIPIEVWVLEGRKRELKCARWLLEKFWQGNQSTAITVTPEGNSQLLSLEQRLKINFLSKTDQGLGNLTDFPLEIDILLPEKKRELIYRCITEFENILEQCRQSQLTPQQLHQQQQTIVTNLWERTLEGFFGKFTALNPDQTLVSSLLKDRNLVQIEILDRIPFVAQLLSSLIFQTPITINYISWEADSPQAQIYAQDILDNLCLQVANAVIQPLVNYFSEDELTKQKFFLFRSSREIEHFRNELSWKYRYHYWVREPRDIFESKQELLVLTTSGIDRMYLNCPRTAELKLLQGWPLILTLILELQDALTPRIRSVVNFVGRGVVFLLTEIIGRGIGLVGKGILRGIGYAWQPDGRIRRPRANSSQNL